MQTRQLEHQIQEAKERADFKRWWIRQQKQQLREHERATVAPPSPIRQRASLPVIISEKGKSIPGKRVAKNGQGAFQDCQPLVNTDISVGEAANLDTLETEAATEASTEMPPPAEASSSSTFQRFLRTVTRSKQSLTQVDGNVSDDEMSDNGDPSYQPASQDEQSSTEESDFFTDDSCTEDEISQRSFQSKWSRDQEPML